MRTIQFSTFEDMEGDLLIIPTFRRTPLRGEVRSTIAGGHEIDNLQSENFTATKEQLLQYAFTNASVTHSQTFLFVGLGSARTCP